MTITLPRAALLFFALIALLLPIGFAVAQNPRSFSSSTANNQQDPVVCFDQTLRNAVDALQAYQAYVPSMWQQAQQCRMRAMAQLDACWSALLEAGPLIQRAGQAYESARHAGTQSQAEPLDRQGQALMAQAEKLVIDAETCFKPIFQAWSQGNGGQRAGRVAGTCQVNVPPNWIIVTRDDASRRNLRNCQPCGDDKGRFVCEPPANSSPRDSGSQPDRALGNGCPDLIIAARTAAASIEAGNPQPNAILNLNKAVQQCPPSFPRPIDCHGMMVDAQSKLRTNPDYARRRAREALACYEGHVTEARRTPPTSNRALCGDVPGYATRDTNGRITLHCGTSPDPDNCVPSLSPDVRQQLMTAAAKLDRIATALQDNAYTGSEHFLQGMTEVLSAFFRGVSETAQHPVQSTQQAANAVIAYLTNDYNANNEQLYLAAVKAVEEWQRDPFRAAGKTAANAAIGAATGAAGELITTGAKVCTAGASKALLARIAKARKVELVLEQDIVQERFGVTAQKTVSKQQPDGTSPGPAPNGVPEPVELTLLKANTRYWDNRTGYDFQTDSLGRPSQIKAGNLLLEKGIRDRTQQQIAGGGNRLPTDAGGHMLGARFAGPENLVNILAQDGNLNLGMWKRLENLWAAALEQGKAVQVEITPIYDGTSWRPTEFDIEYAIDGKIGAVRMKNAPGGI